MATKRPIRLSKELIDQLATYIENGNFAQDACRLVGVSESGFYKWLATGKAINAGEIRATSRNALCVELVEAIKHADAKFKAYHIANINKASKTTWQASAWMLERRFPDDYGRRGEGIRVESEGTVKIYIPDNNRDGEPNGDGNSVTA